MPNWCYNNIEIFASDKDRIVNSEGQVDFSIICPMADELNVTSGGTNEMDMYVFLSNRLNTAHDYVCGMPDVKEMFNNMFAPIDEVLSNNLKKAMELTPDELNEAYLRGKQLVHNYKTYGATTWYEWRLQNWGCKWNAGDTSVINTKNKKKSLTISFTTPWGPPTAWLAALAEKGIVYNLRWQEEDCEFGVVSSHGTADTVKGASGRYVCADEYGVDEDDEDDIEDYVKRGWYVITSDSNIFQQIMDNNDIKPVDIP